MIAYSKQWLDNLQLQEEAEQAFHKNYLSETELAAARHAHPVGFYTPNVFVRIGLAILTVVITLFSSALMALVFAVSLIETAGILALFQGLVAYIVLEFIIRDKHHYRSGVDDVLLWGILISMAGGLNTILHLPVLGNAIIIFLFSLFLLLRFADRPMAVAATVSLAAIAFLSYTKLGATAKATAPILVMALFCLVYFGAKRLQANETCKHYVPCLTTISVTALGGCYAAGNFFLVRESGNILYDLHLKATQGIPFGWLFWLFTIIIPILYIITGLRNKDRLLLRTGLLLSVATVLTIRYYYHLLSAEMAMCIGGILLTGTAYLLLRRLKTPRQGFTAVEQAGSERSAQRDAEALVIGLTAIAPQHSAGNEHRSFGGGSGGGGGATGNY